MLAMVIEFAVHCWCDSGKLMRIASFPRYHCKHPKRLQSHKTGHYLPVMVSNAIKREKDTLGRRMRRLCEMCVLDIKENRSKLWMKRVDGFDYSQEVILRGFQCEFRNFRKLPRTASRFTCLRSMLSVQDTVNCIRAMPINAPATIWTPSVHETKA